MAEVYAPNVGVLTGPRGVVTDFPCNQVANATVSGLAFTGSGLLHAVILTTAATGGLVIWDNTTNSGTQLLTVGAITTGGVLVPMILDVIFGTGLFISFTTANGTVSLAFRTK